MVDKNRPALIWPASSASALGRAERALARAGRDGLRRLARVMARRAAGAGGDIRILGHRLHRQLGAPDRQVRRRAMATRIALYAAVLHRGAMVRPAGAVWHLTPARVDLYCER